MTTGDGFLERYLTENGYDPGRHEPDLSADGIRVHPDFLVRRGDAVVACEVKQFRAGGTPLEGRLARQRVAAASPREVYGRIREQVSAAAKKLKKLKVLKIPLVVVLANPERAQVDLSVPTVLAALYGNPTVEFRVDLTTGGKAGQPVTGFGRDGKLTNDHSHISAVALLRRRARGADRISQILAELRADSPPEVPPTTMVTRLLDRLKEDDVPTGDDLYVDVIETASQSANPLPEGWFDGVRDTRWRINSEGRFEAVRAYG